MNGIHSCEAFGIEQSTVDNLGNRARGVVGTEQVASTGLVRLRIRSGVFMLHERIPDSGRNFHLVGLKRLKTVLESFALALRSPDFERLLAISGKCKGNL